MRLRGESAKRVYIVTNYLNMILKEEMKNGKVISVSDQLLFRFMFLFLITFFFNLVTFICNQDNV